MDPVDLVASAYDQIAEAYLRRFGDSAVKAQWARELVRRLPPGGHVLDLGCGAGLPLARDLVAAGLAVTGIDASARQVELARQNVPQARFIQGDMASAAFDGGAFGAVAAFYSLNHLPRVRYGALLRSIHDWLRPGGVFVGNFGAADEVGWTGEWLGAQTFFSGYDRRATLQLVAEAGFELEAHAIDADPLDEAEFVWVVARRPVS